MTPTTRPALTEPATRAGEELLADLFGDDVIRAAILAIEAEAVQREREELVLSLAAELRIDTAKARRLLGLGA